MRSGRPLVSSATRFGAMLSACALVGGSCALAACGASSDATAGPSGSPVVRTVPLGPTRPRPTVEVPAGTLAVAAPSALHGFVDDISGDLTDGHPDTSVQAEYDSSDALAERVRQRLPADVFISADPAVTERLVRDQLIDTPVPFATNRLALIVRHGNPKGINGVDDLGKAGRVALCDPVAPCGAATSKLLSGAGSPLAATDRRIMRVDDVDAATEAVGDGRADAGVVFTTTAHGDPDVEEVAIPDQLNVSIEYTAAVVRATAKRALAQTFVAYLRSPLARQSLEDRKFGVPPA